MRRFIKTLRHLEALREALIADGQWHPPVYYDTLDSRWDEIEADLEGLIADLKTAIESAHPATTALDWLTELQRHGGNGTKP